MAPVFAALIAKARGDAYTAAPTMDWSEGVVPGRFSRTLDTVVSTRRKRSSQPSTTTRSPMGGVAV
jgi:hypothetical protein